MSDERTITVEVQALIDKWLEATDLVAVLDVDSLEKLASLIEKLVVKHGESEGEK